MMTHILDPTHLSMSSALCQLKYWEVKISSMHQVLTQREQL